MSDLVAESPDEFKKLLSHSRPIAGNSSHCHLSVHQAGEQKVPSSPKPHVRLVKFGDLLMQWHYEVQEVRNDVTFRYNDLTTVGKVPVESGNRYIRADE